MPATAVKRTISLPKDLADEVEQIARAERRSLSSVIQEALRIARSERLKHEFRGIQGYWSRKARDKGIITESDLRRYLRDCKVVFDTNIIVSAVVFPENLRTSRNE